MHPCGIPENRAVYCPYACSQTGLCLRFILVYNVGGVWRTAGMIWQPDSSSCFAQLDSTRLATTNGLLALTGSVEAR